LFKHRDNFTFTGKITNGMKMKKINRDRMTSGREEEQSYIIS
jgi:hypothetical protein